MRELVRALGRDRSTVVGHDWGGGIAWMSAHLEPAVVERLVVLNCPHPAALGREIFRNRKQRSRSRYMFFFALPRLPERALTRNRAEAVVKALTGGSPPAAWPPEEVERYREAFLEPGAASAALGYYRAALRRPLGMHRAASERRITAPTLVLWGVRDRFLGEELIRPDRLLPWFAPGNAPDVRRIEGAGHFVQNDLPDRVNQELLSWLGPTSHG